MNVEDRTWKLAAKKMANEASAEELLELDELLRLQPDMKEKVALLLEWWDSGTGRTIEPGNPALFKKILERIKDNTPDVQAAAVSTGKRPGKK
jgi:putative ABC transport system permease protein